MRFTILTILRLHCTFGYGHIPTGKRRLDTVLLDIPECYDGCLDARLTLNDLYMTYDFCNCCMGDLGYLFSPRLEDCSFLGMTFLRRRWRSALAFSQRTATNI